MANTFNLDNIRVLTHSAIRIQSNAGTVVYVDPYNLTDETHDADFVLVTHAHYDHFSPEDIARVAKEGTELVAPASMADDASQAGLPYRSVEAGQRLELADIAVEVVPAYNVEPERQGFHPKPREWVGYVLTVDGSRIYIAGDTDQNPDNSEISCDIALIPIGGTYTMDPHQAATLINTISPRVAIPTHYGSVAGSMDDPDTFKAEVNSDIKVVIKLER